MTLMEKIRRDVQSELEKLKVAYLRSGVSYSYDAGYHTVKFHKDQIIILLEKLEDDLIEKRDGLNV